MWQDCDIQYADDQDGDVDVAEHTARPKPMTGRKIMQIKLLVSAAAIALAAGVGSASADENFGTLDGISAFDSLAGIQAIPLDTAEMASITGSDFLRFNRQADTWVVIDSGHWYHYTHKKDHGVKGPDGGGRMVEWTDGDWIDSGAMGIHATYGSCVC